MKVRVRPSTVQSLAEEVQAGDSWRLTYHGHPAVHLLSVPTLLQVPSLIFFCRYVYDHIGGDHSAVIPELAASVATFVVTTLWLGPCDIVYLWSVLNCFGLNFELWVQKLAEHGPLAQFEVGRKVQGWDWLGSVGSQEVVALLLPGVTQACVPGPELSPLTSLVCQGCASPSRELGVPGF